MMRSLKGVVAGTLALASVAAVTVDAQAMPIQPLTSATSASGSLEHVWWRGGWGWRGGYGWRRPFYGYGWRRPFYGYGWRRPFYGYGWRRPYGGYYGWRRW